MTNSEPSKQIQLESAAATSVGRVREINEDRYSIDPYGRLFVVADGMGGHAAGEVASQMAVEKIVAELAQGTAEAVGQPKEVLLHALHAVHRAIRAAAQRDPKLKGMGTTIVFAWTPTGQNPLWLAHIGDSRCYLLRENQLRQLTEDHTLLNQALKLKENAVELDFLPSKHLLSQALGASERISPGVMPLELLPGDLLLLCSDGLTDMLTDEDVRLLLAAPGSLEDICQRLVDEANHRGGRDNCTVLLLRLKR